MAVNNFRKASPQSRVSFESHVLSRQAHKPARMSTGGKAPSTPNRQAAIVNKRRAEICAQRELQRTTRSMARNRPMEDAEQLQSDHEQLNRFGFIYVCVCACAC